MRCYRMSENEYVSSHSCQACPAGTYNACGDTASGPDTLCDSTSFVMITTELKIINV